jgi:hypothetical protein
MSLYEASAIVPGQSFLARDLLRGGAPVLISERTATRTLKEWDRIAARIVVMGHSPGPRRAAGRAEAAWTPAPVDDELAKTDSCLADPGCFAAFICVIMSFI